MKLPAIRPLTLAALLLAATCAPLHAEAPYSFAATPGKLPKNVIPLEYTVHIAPDLASSKFRGTVSVEIEVKQTTDQIMLNALNLEIDRASLSGKSIPTQSLTAELNPQQQTLRFALPTKLKPGRYTLAIDYRGPINRESNGLFADTYRTATGEKRMLSTEMEPTDSRRLLPLWDEPSFRARFKLSVDLPVHFKGFSNMPVTKDEPLAGDLHRVTFDLSPKMSSYLLVLSAGELERNAAMHKGVQLGIVATEGKQDSTAYALQSTGPLLDYYNDYFGIAYPLPKLDQIAVPGGAPGAMENWGGIIYNEAALLFDPKRSPESTRQRIYKTMAHEIAHQWFGNLVTMAWWDNLWLNEGFASWMAAKAADKFNPGWKVWLDANSDTELAMNLDARAGAQPIQRHIANEEQAAGAFDGITYQKGQSFLRMLEAYLGEDVFRKGIRGYMAKHQYSNTTSADLWTALSRASGKPVEKIASGWTTQAGFPVVKVEATCKGERRSITLTQEQFRLDEAESGERLWQVPVQVGVVGGKAEYVLLGTRSTTITRPGCAGTLIVDPDAVGYYRVQYAPALSEALAKEAGRLPDAARVKLLSDSWALMAAQRIPLATYLDLWTQLADDPRQAVWKKLLGDAATLDGMLSGQDVRVAYRRHLVALLTPKFRQLGWDPKPGESVEDVQLRPAFVEALAQAGDDTVVAEGMARFQRYLADPSSLSPTMIGPVLNIAGRYADQATYDKLRELGAKAISTEEKARYFRAYAGARDPKLAAQTMQMALSTSLPPVFVNNVLREVARHDHLEQAWAFARQHGPNLVKTLDAIALPRYFPSIVAPSSDARIADQLEAFLKVGWSPEVYAEGQRRAAEIRNRAALKARLLPQMEQRFK